MGMAVGGCEPAAAARAAREAPVHAVTVRIAGNDEYVLFRACRSAAGREGRKQQGRENGAHDWLVRKEGWAMHRMRSEMLRRRYPVGRSFAETRGRWSHDSGSAPSPAGY